MFAIFFLTYFVVYRSIAWIQNNRSNGSQMISKNTQKRVSSMGSTEKGLVEFVWIADGKDVRTRTLADIGIRNADNVCDRLMWKEMKIYREGKKPVAGW